MQFHPPKPKPRPLLWTIAAIALLGFLLPAGLSIYTLWGASTLTYEITPDEVLIVYGPSTSRIEREAIQSVRMVDRPTQGRRHVGTSIPGHYQGRWSFAETGPVTLYATSLERLVIVEAEERKWGISPRDAEGFLAAVESGEKGSFPPVPSDDFGGFAVLGLLPLLLALALGFTVAYLLRVIRGIRYELAPDGLLIHGGWKPIRLPYDKVERVEIAEPEGSPLKSFGVALPDLYWGSFSWMQAGPNLKLHATRLRPLVLITFGKLTYGVSPEEPERFVAALKERLPR